ncbi:MAG: hypothetical protein SFT92_06835 [Rickettsiales bacterium]|nr:hypothetical protein [Rickettsiales bacterium]
MYFQKQILVRARLIAVLCMGFAASGCASLGAKEWDNHHSSMQVAPTGVQAMGPSNDI